MFQCGEHQKVLLHMHIILPEQWNAMLPVYCRAIQVIIKCPIMMEIKRKVGELLKLSCLHKYQSKFVGKPSKTQWANGFSSNIKSCNSSKFISAHLLNKPWQPGWFSIGRKRVKEPAWQVQLSTSLHLIQRLSWSLCLNAYLLKVLQLHWAELSWYWGRQIGRRGEI